MRTITGRDIGILGTTDTSTTHNEAITSCNGLIRANFHEERVATKTDKHKTSGGKDFKKKDVERGYKEF